MPKPVKVCGRGSFVVKAEVRRAGRFGDRHDSGAIVWDAQGRAIGDVVYWIT